MGAKSARVVVVGLGRHALRTVIPAIQASEGWELAAVVSDRPEAREAATGAYGVPGHPTLDAALRERPIDVAYLASVPSRHAPDARGALHSGIGVICEKPLAVSAAEVEDLLAVAEHSDVLLCEVVAYLHHPQFAAAAGLIGGNRFGDLVHGSARFSYPHLGDDDHRYRLDLGGGALLDAGFYPLSMAVRLLGTDLSVHATGWKGERDVDTRGAATIADAAGRTFQCSWGMGSSYVNHARLVGTLGSIEIPRPFSKPAGFDDPITMIGGMGERAQLAYPAADQFSTMLGDILQHRHDPLWRASVRDGIAARWSVIGRVAAAITGR
jgi:NDP-hexose-3-ketoreductase